VRLKIHHHMQITADNVRHRGPKGKDYQLFRMLQMQRDNCFLLMLLTNDIAVRLPRYDSTLSGRLHLVQLSAAGIDKK